MSTAIVSKSNTNKVTISIVIVAYNSYKQLKKLLPTILKSTDIVSKTYIIENFSPERKATEKYVNNFAKLHKDINIQYIKNNKNMGFGSACNQGAALCRSTYILFLNPDTQLKPKSLQILKSHIVNGNYDIMGGECIKNNGDVHRTAVRHPGLIVGMFEFSNLGKLFKTKAGEKEFYYSDNYLRKSIKDIRVEAVSGAYLLVKKTSFMKLNGFDENFFMYLEDVDLGHRATSSGMKVYYCPHSKIIHEGGASSKNKYRIVNSAWYDSRKKYFLKHYGLLTNLVIQPIFLLDKLISSIFRPI